VGVWATKPHSSGIQQIEEQLESQANDEQATPGANRLHSEKQFYLYDALWISLCDLRIAANDLWEYPNVDNAEKFAAHLKKTEVQIMKGSIHIEANHIDSLKRLIGEFSKFKVGKDRLIALMESQSLQSFDDEQIQKATLANGQIKDRYVRLLESIEHSFSLQIKGDTSHSTQTVIESTRQSELSKEKALEASSKISEWLKAKDIWKNDWIDFEEIAEAIGVEVWVVKECIDYAAMLAHLKIESRLANSVLLVTKFGSLS
jgi:hypothetical protein